MNSEIRPYSKNAVSDVNNFTNRNDYHPYNNVNPGHFSRKASQPVILSQKNPLYRLTGNLVDGITGSEGRKGDEGSDSYARDRDKIQEIFSSTVSDMTGKGERIHPYLGNNLRRNIEGLFNRRASDYDPDKALHYLQCNEQTDKVIHKLEAAERKGYFENEWDFSKVDNYYGWRYTQTWGRASPEDSTEPFIYFDPFWNEVSESDCKCESSNSCAPCQP